MTPPLLNEFEGIGLRSRHLSRLRHGRDTRGQHFDLEDIIQGLEGHGGQHFDLENIIQGFEGHGGVNILIWKISFNVDLCRLANALRWTCQLGWSITIFSLNNKTTCCWAGRVAKVLEMGRQVLAILLKTVNLFLLPRFQRLLWKTRAAILPGKEGAEAEAGCWCHVCLKGFVRIKKHFWGAFKAEIQPWGVVRGRAADVKLFLIFFRGF